MWSAHKRLESAAEERSFVYEAWNATRREMVIGVAEQPVDEILAQHIRARPEWIAHWRPDDRVDYKIVEDSLPREDAELFARVYGERCATMNVRVFVDF